MNPLSLSLYIYIYIYIYIVMRAKRRMTYSKVEVKKNSIDLVSQP